jgi:hypothetical protein
MLEKMKKFEKTKKNALFGGGKEKIKKHHAKGKLTARERIATILDPDSFQELCLLAGHEVGAPGDGVIAGFGTIDKRLLCIFSQDATVLGGSVGFLHGKKIYDTIKRALEMRVPCIGLWDSPGGRAMKIDDPNARDSLMEGNEEGGHSIHFPVVQASRHYGIMCRQLRLLSGPHRLYIYDRQNQSYVCYRPTHRRICFGRTNKHGKTGWR